MKPDERATMIDTVETGGRGRRGRLDAVQVPRATYYRWRSRYAAGGPAGLARSGRGTAAWNRLAPAEEARVLTVAKCHPELSPRLLAVRLLDEEGLAISESTVFRLLKARGLIAPRPLDDLPAAKAWKHQTTAPDQIWQCDGTHLFVVGWGYYRGIPVQDDFSRKILAMPVKPDETSGSIADAVELAMEAAYAEGHTLEPKPVLLSDNGAGFIGELLARYLGQHGIRHIFGQPYHPQTQGKVEHVNKRIKGVVNLLVYCTPDEMEQAVAEAVRIHNETPREALQNVSPNDVYAGRQRAILARRVELKRLTYAKRKEYNRTRRATSSIPDGLQVSQNV